MRKREKNRKSNSNNKRREVKPIMKNQREEKICRK